MAIVGMVLFTSSCGNGGSSSDQQTASCNMGNLTALMQSAESLQMQATQAQAMEEAVQANNNAQTEEEACQSLKSLQSSANSFLATSSTVDCSAQDPSDQQTITNATNQLSSVMPQLNSVIQTCISQGYLSS